MLDDDDSDSSDHEHNMAMITVRTKKLFKVTRFTATKENNLWKAQEVF